MRLFCQTGGDFISSKQKPRRGHHIIPIVVNKTRSCACKLIKVLAFLTSDLEFFFFYLSKKIGRSGDVSGGSSYRDSTVRRRSLMVDRMRTVGEKRANISNN